MEIKNIGLERIVEKFKKSKLCFDEHLFLVQDYLTGSTGLKQKIEFLIEQNCSKNNFYKILKNKNEKYVTKLCRYSSTSSLHYRIPIAWVKLILAVENVEILNLMSDFYSDYFEVSFLPNKYHLFEFYIENNIKEKFVFNKIDKLYKEFYQKQKSNLLFLYDIYIDDLLYKRISINENENIDNIIWDIYEKNDWMNNCNCFSDYYSCDCNVKKSHYKFIGINQ